MRTVLLGVALASVASHQAVVATMAKVGSCNVDESSKSDCGFLGIDLLHVLLG